MGAYLHLKLLRCSDDDDYQKKLKVLLACIDADVDLPPSINEYFGGDGVDNDPEYPLEISYNVDGDNLDCIVNYSDECSEGYEIHVDKLPDGVKTIRVCISY
jgi:hypothetical protein